MLERRICGNILRMGSKGHVMRCVVRRGSGEVKEILGGGMMR